MSKSIDRKRLELLAPAGDFECAKVAIRAGADAIYMGGVKYGARAFAKSTTDNSLVDTIKYVKENNKKLYLTVNTLLKEKELGEIFLYIDPIANLGIDAFIVADLGVAKILKEKYKDINIHASTQMTITSSKAINLLKPMGFSKFILARELSLKEIREIRKEIGDEVELEVFVHGSMCYSYSGACLMSSFIGGESGNRGRCKGPCRLPYSIDKNRSRNEKYLLSMKDMCAIENVKSLIVAGVNSFKIEGRMRKPEYVEGVTKIYRKYIDESIRQIENDDSADKDVYNTKIIENDKKYLLSLYNKGGFTNYFDKHNGKDMIQLYERK